MKKNIKNYLYGLLCLIAFNAMTVQAYSTRVPVTIENPTAAPLTNYTFKLELNATNSPGFNWANNGDDIYVSDSATALSPLDFFLESFSAVDQEAVIWVELPSVPVSPPDTTIYIYYDDATATSLSSAANTFTQSGFKYHTQPYTGGVPGPESLADGEALFNFDSVTTDPNYGCTNLGSLETDNSSTFGANGDVGYYYETFFEVPTGATYGFRLGADFGVGGELYIDGATVEADWSDDLWWSLSYTNPDILTGDILLSSGFHTLKALGFEVCCDGPSGIQYRTSPTSPWVDFEVGTPGLTLYSSSCPVTEATFGTPETVPVTLSEFSSQKIGPFLKLNWQTADESFNVGFNLWAKLDDQWQQINKALIRNYRVDSTDSQDYEHSVNLNLLNAQPEYVALSSVDVTAKQEFHGPFAINESYGQSYVKEAIDWSAVVQENDARMQLKGYKKVNSRWRKLKQTSANQESVVAVEIDKEGVYRISYEELLALGVDWSGIHKQHIAVSYQKNGIPRWVGGSRYFNKGSYIEFAGLVPSLSVSNDNYLYQDTAIFTLSVDPHKALRSPKVKRKPTSPASWYMKSVELKDKANYVVQSPSYDPWQLGILVASKSPKSVSYDLDVNGGFLKNKTASLTLDVNGITDLPAEDFDGDGVVDDEHHVLIYINDKLVNESTFDGAINYPISVQFDSQLLVDGANQIKIALSGTTGYLFDFVSIESITLDYPVSSIEQGLSVINSSEYNETDQIDGFSFLANSSKNVRAYAYQDDFNLVRLRPAKQNKTTWAVPTISGEGVKYWVSTDQNLLQAGSMWVLPEAKTDLISSPVELLIISHPSFINDELKAYSIERANQGVSNKIISTGDIAQKYGIDVPLHKAIKRFLKEENQEVYKSVLLVGGHTYDYKNYLQNASINFIPSFYQAIGLVRFSPTDVPFVDFDDDGIPEKAIGRWPVRTESDLNTIIRKSIAWSQSAQARADNGLELLLLSDLSTNLNFPETLNVQAETINSQLLVKDTQKLYIDDVIQGSTQPISDDFKMVREKVVEQVNDGLDWLVYNGHGSIFTWSNQGLLNSASIAKMNNAERPILITSMACYTTYYESPSHQSLAHQLLFGGNRGAVLIHGPMMLGEYYAQLKLAAKIADLTVKGAGLGDIIQQAKTDLPINSKDTSYNWALLGDPTLQIQPSKQ